MRRRALSLTFALLATSSWALAADTWSTPQPGVQLLERTQSSPAQRIYAAFVSLCEPGMHARATRYSERRQRTSSFAQSVDALVAINGAFFEYSQYNAIGWSIGDGETWPVSSDVDHYSAVAFGSYARAKIFDTEETFPPAENWWREMVPGDPLLVDDGVVVQESCYSHMCERHPRSAVGLTQDQKKVLLVAVDGRKQGVATGMTRLELAQLMLSLGAYRALNFDGGGSTTLYVKGRGVVNSPSDGSERVVSSHLAFTLVPGDKGCCQHQEVAGATGIFKDIPDSSWVRPYAEALYHEGVTSGCQAQPLLFCPDCAVDRASLAVFIARALGLNPVTPVTFTDVPPDAWYAGHVEALRQAGITNGCAQDKFCPDRLATRWETAAFIFRGMGLSDAQVEGKFSDVSPTQAPIVEALANACVTSGCSATEFCPDREVTRAEVAKFVAVGFSIGGYQPCIASDAGVDAPDDASATDASSPDSATETDSATGYDAPASDDSATGYDAPASDDSATSYDAPASDDSATAPPDGSAGSAADASVDATPADAPGGDDDGSSPAPLAAAEPEAQSGGCGCTIMARGPDTGALALLALAGSVWLRRSRRSRGALGSTQRHR